MDRRELILRLERIRTKLGAPLGERCPIRDLITDIRVDGVLDVQCPVDLGFPVGIKERGHGPKPTNPDRPVLKLRPHSFTLRGIGAEYTFTEEPPS